MNKVFDDLKKYKLFSSDWHNAIVSLAKNKLSLSSEIVIYNIPIVDQGIHDVLNHYNNDGWQAFIDDINNNLIFGWCKKSNSEMPQFISLRVNGKCIEPYLEANKLRKDLLNANIGNGHYGYEYKVDLTSELYSFITITVPDSKQILAFRFSCLADMIDLKNVFFLAVQYEEKKDYATALQYFKELIYREPENIDFHHHIISLLNKIDNLDEANSALDDMIKNTGKCPVSFINIAWKNQKISNQQALHKTLERIYRADILINRPDKIFDCIFVYNQILQNDSSKIHRFIYNNLFLTCMDSNSQKRNNENFTSLLANKICVFASSVKAVKFIAPILVNLPFFIYDIVLPGRTLNDRDILASYDLGYATVIYGTSNIDKYKIILIDQNIIATWFKDRNFNEKKIIVYTHATDAGDFCTKNAHLFIVSSLNQHNNPNRFIKNYASGELFDNLSNIHYSKKLEYGVTGPYHIGKFLNKKYRNKYDLREKLCEVIKKDISKDKPLIFFLEDDKTNPGQIIVGLNKLSKQCTIIAKFLHISQLKYCKLAPEIILYQDEAFAPNIPRFAADFILCGFDSGSFTTCLMLGLPVLPYYSRYLCNRYDKSVPAYKFSTFIEACKKVSWSNVKNNIHKLWNRHFDIIDTDSILNAIYGTEYIDWYNENLKFLQTKIFGDFFLEDAPVKAAEYIVKFASFGTLGIDASCVSFKK